MSHKLLLADDSVTIQRVIELTFADEDVQVLAVGDGMKAIAAIQAERPDIVLADVGMPERDGYEVAAFIKGNPQLAHIPVLLLTGAFEPVDETRARAVGCDGVLVKPFEPQMVINRVKDLLAGRRPGGAWSQAQPAVQPPARQAVPPAADFDLRASAPKDAPAAPAGSLEDYFDRLDAAFANLDGASPADSAPVPPAASRGSSDFAPSPPAPPPAARPPAPAFSAADDLAGWDPDLTGDPSKPGAIEPPPVDMWPAQSAAPAPPPGFAPAQPAAPYAPPPSASAAPSAASAASVPMPSLAEAFAALLSAEQSQQISPSTIASGTPVSDDMIEEVVRRVIARMNDDAVRETVLDVAERLVREEIDRIKRG
jgi:CheY-like chemotaxis protein